MDRRQLLTGTVALVGNAQIKKAFAGQQVGGSGGNKTGNAEDPPKNLLTTAYPPGVLSQHLVSPANWHPFPRWDERDAWQSIPEDVRGAVVQRAEAIVGTPWDSLPATSLLEFKRNGNRTHYERLYYSRQERITDLTIAECIEGKGRFLDEITNGVWLTCEETFWGLPAHLGAQKAGTGLPDIAEPIIDLFAAETSATLSWVYYYLGARLDQVSPLIRPRIVTEAKRRILDPALARDDFSWMGLDGSGRRLNNWTPWINSNWLATNLILEPDPARRVAATSKICSSLDHYLSGYSPDGGCDEGPGYWNVSAASYFDCCDMLASATGGQINVVDNPFIAKMVQYIADVHIADGDYVNYGDAHVKAGPSPELVYRLGSAVRDTVLEEFGAFNIPQSMTRSNFSRPLGRAIPNMMIVGKARSSPKADALVRDAWYPDLCLMTARRTAATSDGFYLAVQAAPNLRSHGHNDSGSFIVFHNGQPVFIDVGVEAYTAKTFSRDRYSIWTMQSAYHNLPTIGGVMQRGDQARYRASEIHYDRNDDRTVLSMNLATAYPEDAGVTRWMRTVTLERKSDQIRLQERFQLKQKSPIWLSFMTPRIPSDDSHGTVSLSGADNSVRAVSLTYDVKLLKPSFEQIPLEDEGLRENWGKEIYRVLLSSISPTDSGEWELQMS
jgi:hypothetical protein